MDMTAPYAADVNHDAFLVTLAPRSLWSFAKKPKKDASGRRNPVAVAYFELWALGFTRWLFSLVALAFSVLTVHWKPSSPLYEAALAQVVIVRSHLPPSPMRYGELTRHTRLACTSSSLTHTSDRVRQPTRAPPQWYPILFFASAATWAVVMSFMIALLAGDTTDITLDKRAYGRVSENFNPSGYVARRLMYLMIIADAMALLCNLGKAYYWYKLRGKFDHGDIRETYFLSSKHVDEKAAGDVVC